VQVCPTLRAGGNRTGGDRPPGTDVDTVESLICTAMAFDTTQITSAANYSHPKPGDPCHPLAAGAHAPAVALQDVRAMSKAQNGCGWNADGTAYTVDTHATQGVATTMQVRRLTPVECERLQGFPDGYTLIPKRVVRQPVEGPCAKQTVTATLVATSGTHYIATNGVAKPQAVCPRAGMPTGEGYELCRSVCEQPAHAEVAAIALAGRHARGATLYLTGHTYACEDCQRAAREAGVADIVIGPAPGNAADGPRYKALGNSFAVPVVSWIGQRIAMVDRLTNGDAS